ncbi:MAG: CBS domain-containing protein [archaeon]
MNISSIMSKEPTVIFGGDTIQKASEIMALYNRGMLVVINSVEEKKVIGVLSNKDVVNRLIAKKLQPDKVFVSELMTKNFISASPDTSLSEAMLLMRKYRIKRLVVLQNGILQGIVSTNDILNAMLKHKEDLLKMAIDF